MQSCPEGNEDLHHPVDVRKGSRQRTLTEKGQQMLDEEVQKIKNAFNKAYNLWKQAARENRKNLKAYCADDALDQVQCEVIKQFESVRQCYEPFRRKQIAQADIVKKMDTCDTLTREICDLVKKRKETTTQEFNNHLEKERVRMCLSKQEHRSVFGYSETETQVSSWIHQQEEIADDQDSHSGASSRASSKRADAEADLAAQLALTKAMETIQVQETKLRELESEWKIKEAEMRASIKQKEAQMTAELSHKEAEISLQLEKEKTKLKQMYAQREVKVAAARVKAYDTPENNLENMYPDPDLRWRHDPSTVPIRLREPPCEQNNLSNLDTMNLAQAIASSLNASRLSAPEPPLFSGDPLKYIDWKTSFSALIDRIPLPVSEKMFYLKTYLTGEARRAVDGFFFRDSDDAYRGAWSILEERYGDPFLVKRAFRQRLSKWPKIGPKDPPALREFADFLQSCLEAMPYVKGLSILDDCEENHKLLGKLPEWITRKWNRIVVEELDSSGSYPGFARFTEFVRKEARIACNPIASPFTFNTKIFDERSTKTAKALNTSAHPIPKNKEQHKESKPPCVVCQRESHGIATCSSFASKTMVLRAVVI